MLDDYLRLWIAQAHLNLGETKEAAVLLESIPMAVPDSNILARAAYKTGEAWYQASACPESTVWFTKAVAMNDKDTSAPQAFLRRAACRLRDNTSLKGATASLSWVRSPYTPESQRGGSVVVSQSGGETWPCNRPTD